MEKNLLLLPLISMVLMSCQQPSQAEMNSVYVQFDKNEGYLLELSEWTDNEATNKFKMITANGTNGYCTGEHAIDCELAEESTFVDDDVVTSEPEAYNGDIRFSVYISLSGKNVSLGGPTTLPKEALINILKGSQNDYNTMLADDEADYNITLMFVDEVRVATPLDHTTNYIMIVVSILILLSALILALVLKCKESMDEKRKLEHFEGNRGSARSQNEGAEHVTLTTIKPSDDDSKDASEGPVKV